MEARAAGCTAVDVHGPAEHQGPPVPAGMSVVLSRGEEDSCVRGRGSEEGRDRLSWLNDNVKSSSNGWGDRWACGAQSRGPAKKAGEARAGAGRLINKRKAGQHDGAQPAFTSLAAGRMPRSEAGRYAGSAHARATAQVPKALANGEFYEMTQK